MRAAALSYEYVRQRVQVPNLAHEIVTRQRGMPDSQRSINLQGFLVGEHAGSWDCGACMALRCWPSSQQVARGWVGAGNAWTNARIENMGAIDFWWSHSLISDVRARLGSCSGALSHVYFA